MQDINLKKNSFEIQNDSEINKNYAKYKVIEGTP